MIEKILKTLLGRRRLWKIADWYKFGKDQGFWFAFLYKTGRVKGGKDFW